MKIKDYLLVMKENTNGVIGLFGKELKILEPYFDSVQELKDKKIEIIEDLKNSEETQVISIESFESLNKDIKLYSISLYNDEVSFRCSEETIKKASKTEN